MPNARSIRQAFANALDRAKSWCALNAFLTAACLLLLLSFGALFSLQEHDEPFRDPQSVLTLGVEFNSAGESPPIFSVFADAKGQWWVVVRGAGPAGTSPVFSLTRLKSIGKCVATHDSLMIGERPLIMSVTAANFKSRYELASERMWFESKLDQPEHIRFTIPRDVRPNDDTGRVSYQMSCALSLTPMQDGAVERSIQIRGNSVDTMPSLTNLGDHDKIVILDLSGLTDRQSIELIGGQRPVTQMSESSRSISEHDPLTIRWRSGVAAFHRDVMLLAIGALLGVAGACFIEWLRPLLERAALTRAHKRLDGRNVGEVV